MDVCAICSRSECESSPGSEWTQCDICKQWHHNKCVGLGESKTTEDWTCSPCKGNEEAQLTDTQKKLQESQKELELIKGRRERQVELQQARQKY
jgi:hypothetical protein